MHRFNLMERHAPLNPPVDGTGFVLGKIVPGLGAEEDKDFLQRILAF
jgi:hypothetical protein